MPPRRRAESGTRAVSQPCSRASGEKGIAALLRCGISIWAMSAASHSRRFQDVRDMSGLPESGHGWAIYEYRPRQGRDLTKPHLLHTR
jgi:hypothetical protein